jgi:hypothetical protein
MVFKALTTISVSLAASCAFAFDYSEADALFAKRGEGDIAASIKTARTAYENAVPQVSGAELTHAVSQLGRLDFFEGLSVNDNDRKKVIFDVCIKRADLLDNTSVEFHYWKGVCIASWANANGILSSLRRSGEVESFLLKGRAIDARFEGGGFDRVLAFVYLKVPPINPMGPTRDLKKALASVDAAIASAAYPGEADASTSTGDYFFNAYDVKAQILTALGRKDEAVTIINDAISRIEQGDLPTGREPETRLILQDLKKTLAEISK